MASECVISITRSKIALSLAYSSARLPSGSCPHSSLPPCSPPTASLVLATSLGIGSSGSPLVSLCYLRVASQLPPPQTPCGPAVSL